MLPFKANYRQDPRIGGDTGESKSSTSKSIRKNEEIHQ